MSRGGAFLLHLAISLAVFALLAWVVVYVWYPDFFFTSDGGWQGIRLIVLVDLSLGPLLTLVVFNRNKPRAELRRDLTLVGTLQAACLVAGTYVVYSERPLALVYVDGQFYSMSADDYTEAGVARPDLSAFPGPYPKRVVVQLPEDLSQQVRLRAELFSREQPLRTLVDHYRPMSYEQLQVADESLNADALRRRDDRRLDDWLDRHGGPAESYAFFPFAARYGYLFLGVDKTTQSIAGLVNVPRFGNG